MQRRIHFPTMVEIVGALIVAVVMAACSTRTPAPVIDRPAPRPGATVPTPPPAARIARPEFYAVRTGDTVRSIANSFNMEPRELAELNTIADSSRLQVGQVLRLRPAVVAASPAPPTPALPPEPTVQVNPIALPGSVESRPLESRPLDAKPAPPPVASVPGSASGQPVRNEPRAYKLPYSDDTLVALQRGEAPVIARVDPRPGSETSKLPGEGVAKPEAPKVEATKPEAAKPEAPKPPAVADDRVDWLWPANGRLVEKFDDKTNKGVNIAGKSGEPVYAAASGRVMYSGSNLRGYGQLVIIKHNEIYLSAYAHNSRLLVKEGQTVTRGQKIAEIGQTDADQPKLHFEIRRSGKPVDPLAYLPERP